MKELLDCPLHALRVTATTRKEIDLIAEYEDRNIECTRRLLYALGIEKYYELHPDKKQKPPKGG